MEKEIIELQKKLIKMQESEIERLKLELISARNKPVITAPWTTTPQPYNPFVGTGPFVTPSVPKWGQYEITCTTGTPRNK